jgi:hypothetical protein
MHCTVQDPLTLGTLTHRISLQLIRSVSSDSQSTSSADVPVSFIALPPPITRFSKAVLYSLCHHSKHRASPTQPHAFHFYRSAKFDPYKWLVSCDVTLSVIYAVNLCLIILTQPIPKVHKIQLAKLLINILSHKSMVAGKAYYSAFGNSLCT